MNRDDKRPLVSVITPSYNQGEYIEETIRSVLSQDYPRIELIVVDGGSTDNTLDVLRRYGERLRWVSERDRGQSDAINKGAAMASGEILAWLNSDDTYLEGAVRKAVEFFDSHPDVGVVYGKSYYTDPSGRVVGEYPTAPFDPARLAVTNFICQPSTFFRKTIWDAVGGLDLSLHYAMDYDLWIRMAAQADFGYLDEFLSTYRLHGQSKTVSPAHALSLQREILYTVVRHYRWAPANRVYGYCHHLAEYMLPGGLARIKTLTVLLSLMLLPIKYMISNRGMVRIEDVKMITPGNMKKLFKDWIEVSTGYRP